MNKELSIDQFSEVMVPNYAPAKEIPVKGKGSRVWDQNNTEYIDFAGGIAVTLLGHCHPELVEALKNQSEKLWHLSNVLANEPAISLAKKIVSATFADKVFFANSGAEVNEAALKLARKYAFDNFGPEKFEIISFKNSFHGRTIFTVSVGGQPKYTEGFGPVPSGIKHVEYNNIDELKETISEKTCGVIIEPIQGEGGIVTPDREFLKEVRNLCDENKALLIFDEIQTGMGRTGNLYEYMNIDIEPDILTSAKGLGGGFPIGAMLTKNHIAESLGVGTHGTTYGGNPLATAVGDAVFSIVNNPELLKGVIKKRSLFENGLNTINNEFNIFSEIRGKGLLIGCALKDEWKGQAGKFVEKAMEHGLLLLVAGPDVVRIAPSLIIPDKDISEGLDKFYKAVEQVYIDRDKN